MKKRIIECIHAAIDDANQNRDGKEPLEKAPETPIHGPSSGLDSLGLVNFIVVLEENLEHAFDTVLVLSDDRAISATPSPFLTVGTLADYIEARLKEDGAATAGEPGLRAT